MTVNEVKTLLRIKDDSLDTYIEITLPLIKELVLKYTNQTEIKEGMKLAIAKWIDSMKEDNRVQSESLSDMSISYFDLNNSNGMPSEVKAILKPYRRVKFI
ncbi:phage head-tail connector protein [Dethiothermospora halolimnae]|uniref:phage head-tail connector protein n=1 Tax=Dethiothermospora halolimnae TaxID=3114390 RepID=UPI003CCC4123